MKPFFILILLTAGLQAHPWKDGAADKEAMRRHVLEEWMQRRAASSSGEIKPLQVASAATMVNLAAVAAANAAATPPAAKPFLAFPRLELKWDKDFLFIGSNGMPDHGMMVGIKSWQQQVPLPQYYLGDNAWRIPLHPMPAKTPAVIEGHFLRGAIAIAANGIPIFNPQNNRGEVSYEIGELDQWGGHCGRADDYHYHIAPLHLQAVVGKGMPIAYALDGYPLYGLTEPDGSPVGKVDECHGHDDAKIGYHYHAAMKRPYLQSAFHGVITESGGQVDPQPRAQGVRPDTAPLRGAEITGFENTGPDSYKLSYQVGGETRFIAYSIRNDGTYPFEFNNGHEGVTKEVYARRGGGPQKKIVRVQPPPDASASGFVLTSPEVVNGGNLPAEYTGDGSGATLPLEWKGAPADTKSYALIMDHLAPGNEMKSYWVMWGIPADVTSLPKNVKGVGMLGTGFRGMAGYEPPHSKGPGAKTYVLHVYALSDEPVPKNEGRGVTRESLLRAMEGKILAKADLSVIYSRGGVAPPGPPEASVQPSSPMPPPDAAAAQPGGQRKPWMQTHGAELDSNRDGFVVLEEAVTDMKAGAAKYDADKDGVITPAEIDAAGEVREGAAFAGFIYRHAFELDANQDSRLTTAELEAATKFIFGSADLDHDGRLSATEVQSAPNAPLGNPPAREAR